MQDYTVRYSKKAKYLQLRLSKNGVEVIVPMRQSISTNHIHDFILKKNDWIVKTKQRYQSYIIPSDNKPILPTRIDLQAINESWEVSYIQAHQRKLTIYANPARQIKLIGDILDENACLYLLKNWIKQIAETHLFQLLKKISDEVNIPFHQLSIRNNMTRWGSCTHQKNISLCCRLLFLPIHLVRHILLHELCHIRFMNHGKLFWQLLEKLDPDTVLHRAELKKASLWVPGWL
jgi:predicted metal-dependent hydrolase